MIEENYPALQKQIGFLKTQAKNNLFYWDISDHEAIDPKPEALTASAFYYHHVSLAAVFAGILGEKDDSVTYDKLREQIKQNIVRQFYIPATGRFDNATQSAQLFALWYGLTPDKTKSLEVLQEELKRHSDRLSTGIFSTQMFFDVMRENDLNEIAYQVVNQNKYPGWGYMLQRGATTLWESWDFPETGPSRNHPMFGSVDEWFYRSLLGINPAEPGFRKVIIKPQPAGDLTWAEGSYRSVRGLISSSWKKSDAGFSLEVEIPPNVTAQVWIPSVDKSQILERGKPVPNVQYDSGYAVIEIGSGAYSFQSKAD